MKGTDMVTTVTLQEPFEYYIWVVILAVLLIVSAGLLIFLAFRKLFLQGVFQKSNPKPKIVKPTPQSLVQIKASYIVKLEGIAKGYSNKAIGKRQAYQSLSGIIRGFITEVTGIDVEHYTKAEIRGFGIKDLNTLMNEYYVPEFAEDEKGRNKNFMSSCDKALGVVRKWK